MNTIHKSVIVALCSTVLFVTPVHASDDSDEDRRYRRIREMKIRGQDAQCHARHVGHTLRRLYTEKGERLSRDTVTRNLIKEYNKPEHFVKSDAEQLQVGARVSSRWFVKKRKTISNESKNGKITKVDADTITITFDVVAVLSRGMAPADFDKKFPSPVQRISKANLERYKVVPLCPKDDMQYKALPVYILAGIQHYDRIRKELAREFLKQFIETWQDVIPVLRDMLCKKCRQDPQHGACNTRPEKCDACDYGVRMQYVVAVRESLVNNVKFELDHYSREYRKKFKFAEEMKFDLWDDFQKAIALAK